MPVECGPTYSAAYFRRFAPLLTSTPRKPGRPWGATGDAMRDFYECMTLLMIMLSIAACEQTEAGHVRLAVSGVSQSVVYGEDDRREVYRYDGNTFARANQSLVALIPPHLIVALPGGGKAASPEPAQELLQLCADEPFVDQPAVASCSGVLIDDDLVLTAGHCFRKDEACDTYAYVFDYQYSRRGQAEGVADLDVYGCKALLVNEHQTLPGGRIHDFAVVQLNRKVDLRRRPVPLRADKVLPDEEITVMGSPQGLPNKIDTGGSVRPSPASAFDYWYADTDTFGGSSGSPAYDANLQLVGFLIRGNRDYEQDPELACMRAKRITDEGQVEGRYELFATLGPALSALCKTAEGSGRAVCDRSPPVRGKVDFTCSPRPGARSPAWPLWTPFLLGLASLSRTARARRMRAG